MIAQGHDPVFVAGQLGHSRASITLDVYSHLFDPDEAAQRARDQMEAQFAPLL